MITTNVIQRTFFIEFNNQTASAFTVDFNGKHYLITARHLFIADKTAKPYAFKVYDNSDVTINIFHDNQWKSIIGKIHFHDNIDIDIAVFETPVRLSPNYTLEMHSAGLQVGQDVFFLGFPFQLKGDAGDKNNSFPFPFVKKASFSAIQKGDNDEVIFYFDGHNNPGFSGGPIVFKNPSSNNFQVCGVVRGYVPQKGSINTPLGKASYTENSGIIVSYDIKHCKEIIEKVNVSDNV
jgi:hypothetical protein